MERRNDFNNKKPGYNRGNKPFDPNAKPKMMEATWEKSRYIDFEKAVLYRMASGELELDDAHAHLMLPENIKELKVKMQEWYDKIEIPVRATIGSAGYDMATPIPVKIVPFKRFRIPTGLRAKMPFKQVLKLSSRSSIFGDQIVIDGTIDADYYFSKKTAGIIVIQGMMQDIREMTIDLQTGKPSFGNEVQYEAGHPLANGVFYEYKRVSNEKENPVTKKRDGGFGHTNTNRTTK